MITSFNADRPYDEFVIAQLAADQIDDPTGGPAIGFLTLGAGFSTIGTTSLTTASTS